MTPFAGLHPRPDSDDSGPTARWRAWLALAVADLANLRRDPLLLGASFAPLPIAAALRFGWPHAVTALCPWVDLAPHAPLVLAVAALLVPLLLGSVAGFMLLEERDEGVAEAYAVSPLRPRGWLLWRLVAPVGVAFIGVIGLTEMSGLAEWGPWRSLGVAALAAVEAPLFAALLAGVARNKVEGLALSKALNLLALAPLGWVLGEGAWRWGFALLPTTWPVMVALGESPGWCFVGGLFVSLLWLWGAARRVA